MSSHDPEERTRPDAQETHEETDSTEIGRDLTRLQERLRRSGKVLEEDAQSRSPARAPEPDGRTDS